MASDRPRSRPGIFEIRTCWGKMPDDDLVALFSIDSRDYPSHAQYRQAVDEARAETNRRRLAYDWRTDFFNEETEYRSSQPTWEEYRSQLPD